MKIAVLKEKRENETRVAATPDSITRFIKAGCSVSVESGAGLLSAFSDKSYEEAGAKVAKTAAATLKDANIVLKVSAPMTKKEGKDEIAGFKKGQALLAPLSALNDPELVAALNAKGVSAFSLELVPRITRAQSMDILSSQSNIAGYKAVLDALEYYPRAVPMMSTAAGRVKPANVFIMGVGVAGLQAIATAKRLGAIVWASDVRPATKEQVESLGGKFLAVENDEFNNAQTAGGYAKEMSDEYKKLQADLIAEKIQDMDIVITTALIPGRKAPILLTKEHVKSMKDGAVIVDMASPAGGNCEFSENGKVVTEGGVTIIGHANMPARVPATTSALYAMNMWNFLSPILPKEGEEDKLKLDLEDEIIKGTLVCHQGKILNDNIASALDKK